MAYRYDLTPQINFDVSVSQDERNPKLGKHFRSLRKAKKWSQQDMVRVSEQDPEIETLDYSYISHVEKGREPQLNRWWTFAVLLSRNDLPATEVMLHIASLTGYLENVRHAQALEPLQAIEDDRIDVSIELLLHISKIPDDMLNSVFQMITSAVKLGGSNNNGAV